MWHFAMSYFKRMCISIIFMALYWYALYLHIFFITFIALITTIAKSAVIHYLVVIVMAPIMDILFKIQCRIQWDTFSCLLVCSNRFIDKKKFFFVNKNFFFFPLPTTFDNICLLSHATLLQELNMVLLSEIGIFNIFFKINKLLIE